MNPKWYPLIVLWLVSWSITSCDSCYFGSSESIQSSELVSFVLDINGNPTEQRAFTKIPLGYSYFNNKAQSTSDRSLVRLFDSESNIMNVVFLVLFNQC